MAKAKKAIPEGFSTVTPTLTVHDASAALAWYGKALGAEEITRSLGPDGRAHTIDGPPGPVKVLKGSTNVLVHNYAFSKPKLSIPLGARITWRFPDSVSHDVTLANGPLGFSSLFSRAGRTYTQNFRRPGKYRLFCSLHPVVMHEVVDVRVSGTARARSSGPPAGAAIVHW